MTSAEYQRAWHARHPDKKSEYSARQRKLGKIQTLWWHHVKTRKPPIVSRLNSTGYSDDVLMYDRETNCIEIGMYYERLTDGQVEDGYITRDGESFSPLYWMRLPSVPSEEADVYYRWRCFEE